jgi:hypothetical protein
MRYFNVKTCTVGGVSYTTIQSIDVNQSHQMLRDSGDNDSYTSWSARGPGTTDVSVNLKDPVQAWAMAAANGTLIFRGVPESGGTEVIVTVEGVTFGNPRTSAQHGAVWTGSVSGVASKTDGGNPVTIAAA